MTSYLIFSKGKRGYSASNFFLLSISIVFDVEIKIQVTEMPTIFFGSNSLNEKFGQRGISGHLGQ
jgi:hypothetical protein